MLHRHSQEFRDALLELQHTKSCMEARLPFPLDLPGEVLACLCIETVLKGVLRGHGWCMEHLRGIAQAERDKNVGHDLVRAFNLVLKAGMPPEVAIADEDQVVVEVLGFYWRRRELPYLRTGARHTIGGAPVVACCDRLVAGAEAFCRRQRDLHVLKLDPFGIVQNPTHDPSKGCGCPVPDESIER